MLFYIYTNNEVDFVDVDIDNNNDNNEPLSSRDFRRMSMDVVFFNMLNSQKMSVKYSYKRLSNKIY